MNVLIAAEHLGALGGMERYLEVVLPALVARGVTVHAIARRIDRVPAGITAEIVPWAEEHDAPDAAAASGVRDAIAAFGPSAAIAVNVMDAGVVGALRAVPRLLYQIHDHRPLCPNGDRVFPRTQRNCTAPLGAACVFHALTDGCAYGPRRRTLTLLGRRRALRDAIARSDTVMVASRFVAERAASCGIARARIVEVPPPMPDDAYAENVSEPEPGPSICFAARMVPQKGLLELVRAVARIPPASRPAVRAFGDGPERSEASELARGLDVALTAPGTVSPADVRAGIDCSALVVVPSHWAEPFGMIGIEAFARGRPVVAYDVGGIGSWLRNGENGRTVVAGLDRVERETALGLAIRELLSDRALWARCSARARSDAERYRTAPIVDALLAALTA